LPCFKDGPRLLAVFSEPTGIDLSPDGHIYVADSDNDYIRRISPDNYVVTMAGRRVIHGKFQNTQNRFSTWSPQRPMGVAVDTRGDIAVTDTRGGICYRISRKVIHPKAGWKKMEELKNEMFDEDVDYDEDSDGNPMELNPKTGAFERPKLKKAAIGKKQRKRQDNDLEKRLNRHKSELLASPNGRALAKSGAFDEIASLVRGPRDPAPCSEKINWVTPEERWGSRSDELSEAEKMRRLLGDYHVDNLRLGGHIEAACKAKPRYGDEYSSLA